MLESKLLTTPHDKCGQNLLFIQRTNSSFKVLKLL